MTVPADAWVPSGMYVGLNWGQLHSKQAPYLMSYLPDHLKKTLIHGLFRIYKSKVLKGRGDFKKSINIYLLSPRGY